MKLIVRLLVIMLFVVLPIWGHSQFTMAQWHFGRFASLNFGDYTGNPTPNSNSSIFTEEGSASVCDENGNLLFYTDGWSNIWNRNHQVMQNGGNLGGWFSVAQSALILKQPGNSNIYYVIINSFETNNTRNLTYSVVDMNLDGGLGGVVPGLKNIMLMEESFEGLCGVRHGNNTDYWIISKSLVGSNYHIYLLNSSGIQLWQIQNLGNDFQGANIGLIKSDMTGSQIAVSSYNSGQLVLFKFFNVSGTLGQPIGFNLSAISGIKKMPYGISFSPSGRYLYMQAHSNSVDLTTNTTSGDIYQFDLQFWNANLIMNNRKLVSSVNNYTPLLVGPRFMMQVAPNGTMYLARENQNYLSAIVCPDRPAPQCNYVDNYQGLGSGICGMGLPNFVETDFALLGFGQLKVAIEPPGPKCPNEPFTLKAFNFGNNFSWSPTSGLSNANTATPTVSITNTTTYTVVATNTCKADTAQITVPIKWTGNVTAGNNQWLCIGDTITLGAGNTEVGQYRWSPGKYLSDSTVASPKMWYQNNMPSSIPFTLTFTHTNSGCTVTRNATVTLANKPSVNILPDTTICPFTALMPVQSQPNIGYQWWGNALPYVKTVSGNIPQFYHTGNNNQFVNYKIYVKATNNQTGCHQTDSILITVKPSAQSPTLPDTTICNNTPIVVGNQPLIGYSYLWTEAKWLDSVNKSNPTFKGYKKYNADTTVLLTVWFKNPDGCAHTDTVKVTVRKVPDFEILGNNSVCPNEVQVPYYLKGSTGITLRTFNVFGGTANQILNPDTVLINWGMANPMAKVEAHITDGFGCQSDTESLAVVINQQLVPIIETDATKFCANSANGRLYKVKFPIANSKYLWGTIGGTIVGTNISKQVVVNWDTSATIHRIWVAQTAITATDSCFGTSDTLNLTVWPTPNNLLTINGPDAFCNGQAGERFFWLGGDSGSVYNWAISPLVQFITRADSLFLPDSLVPQTYTLQVTETNLYGCKGPTYQKILRVNHRPNIRFVSGDTFICASNQYQAPYTFLSDSVVNFITEVFGGTQALGQNPEIINWNLPPYRLSAYAIDSFGCKSDTIIVKPQPDFAFPILNYISVAENDENIIEGQFETLDLSRTKILNYFSGSNSQNNISLNQAQFNQILRNGLTDSVVSTYQVTYTNLCGDSLKSLPHSTIVLRGTIDPNETSATLWWSNYLPKGATYQLLTDSSLPNQLSAIVATTADTSAQHYFFDLGKTVCYRVRGQFGNYQTLSNGVCFVTRRDLLFPNIITPNGDGYNDNFDIVNGRFYPNSRFEVINRWGSKVYSATGYTNGFNGTGLSGGVYFYRYQKTPDSPQVSGWLQIVK